MSSCSLIRAEDRYVIANFKKSECSVGNKKVHVIKDGDPTGPTSINTIFSKKLPEELFAFLVCSQEVYLGKRDIEETLVKEIGSNKNLLIVGYKFHIVNKAGRINKRLDDELQNYYKNKELLAYQVPWNTCAIWGYDLFTKYVGKFDEITARNPFNPIGVSIDGVCSQTKHQGMEDGLAIAEAVVRSKKTIKYALLDNYLRWEVDRDRVKDHREKLARKDTVLRNFMAVRNYSPKDLRNAEIK